MNYNKSLFFVAIVIFCSCNKNCIVDYEFKTEFDNCISLVKQINSEGFSSDIDLRSTVYECLFAVTGYEGQVDKGNEPHCYYLYNDSIDYISIDIKKWQTWYDLNKCTMTINKADSLILVHSINHGIPRLKWPAKSH